MNSKKLIVAALALGGVLSAGLAQARGEANVQWSVTIGTPVLGPVYVPAPVYLPAPAYAPAPLYLPEPVIATVRVARPVPVYESVPVYSRPAPVFRDRPYHHVTYWDRDGDGIPNRYDRVYNPPWDRDGDGIPNHLDRDGRRGHHEIDRVERDAGRIGRGSGR